MPVADEPLALALATLARKERSVAELGRWLRDRGVAEDEIGAVVEHLVSVGTLDDSRFAVRFADDKREIAGWGTERIRAALHERGISPVDIDAALASDDPDAELVRAVSLIGERRIDLGDDRGRSRAFGLLVRRGYDSELAYEAIRRASEANSPAAG